MIGGPSSVTAWRFLSYQWLTGASLLTATVLAGVEPQGDTAGLLVIAGLAFGCAAVMAAGAKGLPPATVHVVMIAGNVLVSCLIYLSGEPESSYALYYVWLSVYACHFLGRRAAVGHGALGLGGYAVALSLMAGAGGIWSSDAWWMTAGTLVIVGAMVDALRCRVDRLVAALDDMARTDLLTRLPNRRAFEERIDVELERARRSGEPLGVVIGDLDHFKLVNDRFGHQAGDAALECVASALRQAVRRIDTAARIGGEEFALLVPGSGVDAAYVLAERVRTHVKDAFCGQPAAVTISLGVASFPHDGTCAAELLRAADRALYTAKDRGRDQTVSHHPALTTPDGPDGRDDPAGPPRCAESADSVAVATCRSGHHDG